MDVVLSSVMYYSSPSDLFALSIQRLDPSLLLEHSGKPALPFSTWAVRFGGLSALLTDGEVATRMSGRSRNLLPKVRSCYGQEPIDNLDRAEREGRPGKYLFYMQKLQTLFESYFIVERNVNGYRLSTKKDAILFDQSKIRILNLLLALC